MDGHVEIQLCSFVTPEKGRYGLALLVGPAGTRLRVYSNKKADKKAFLATPIAKSLAAYL